MTFRHQALISLLSASIAICASAQSPGTLNDTATDYLQQGAPDSNLWKFSWEDYWPNLGGPPGGIIWAAVLPASPKPSAHEEIILLYDNLVDWGPYHLGDECTTDYIVAKDGKMVHREDSIAHIGARRQKAGSYQYFEETHVKGWPVMVRILTVFDGHLVEILPRPPKGEDALPDGFEPFTPTWRWIPLAELITAKKPRWRDGDSPKTKEDLEKLAKETPRVSWEQFVEWRKKNKAKDKPTKDSK